MSIVSRVAKFTIRAILAGLAKDAAKCERKITRAVALRDSKIAKLDEEIIAQARREDAEVDKIRAKAEEEVRQILAVKTQKMAEKADVRWNCGAECRHLNKKGQDALALKAKLEAVTK